MVCGLLVVWKTLESGLRNGCTRKAEITPHRQIHIPTSLAGMCPCQQVALSQQAVPGCSCLSPPVWAQMDGSWVIAREGSLCLITSMWSKSTSVKADEYFAFSFLCFWSTGWAKGCCFYIRVASGNECYGETDSGEPISFTVGGK